jgi:hypothetical protein
MRLIGIAEIIIFEGDMQKGDYCYALPSAYAKLPDRRSSPVKPSPAKPSPAKPSPAEPSPAESTTGRQRVISLSFNYLACYTVVMHLV